MTVIKCGCVRAVFKVDCKVAEDRLMTTRSQVPRVSL